jgi:hypothetical protein
VTKVTPKVTKIGSVLSDPSAKIRIRKLGDIQMGYIEIIELTSDGVTVTDLSDISDKVQQELWSALKKGDIK